MSPCEYCSGLTIAHLIELAETEFSGRAMPERAFYRHHRSLRALEASASHGCDGLCPLLLACFRGTPADVKAWPDWPDWVGVTGAATCAPEDSMFAHAEERLAAETDIKICLNSSHVYFTRPLDEVRVFDQLLVHVGPVRETAASSNGSAEEEDDDDGEAWDWEPLVLTLSTPRGMALEDRAAAAVSFCY